MLNRKYIYKNNVNLTTMFTVMPKRIPLIAKSQDGTFVVGFKIIQYLDINMFAVKRNRELPLLKQREKIC